MEQASFSRKTALCLASQSNIPLYSFHHNQYLGLLITARRNGQLDTMRITYKLVLAYFVGEDIAPTLSLRRGNERFIKFFRPYKLLSPIVVVETYLSHLPCLRRFTTTEE